MSSEVTTEDEKNTKVDAPKQPELAKHDATILDLAFVLDCTASMGPYINSATESIRQIVEDIVALEKSDIKLALVEYRDHPPQDATFITKTHDFTESIKEMKKWLEGCAAQGGGDLPEAVADGLDGALKLNWREKSTKICVLISDAPPHGLTESDHFPQGCPKGIDPLVVVKKMAEKGITLYSVGCEPAITPYKDFFVAISYSTGGQYVPLRNAKLLSKVIVGGTVEEISLEKLMEDVQLDVDEQRSKGITDEKVLSEYVEGRLKSRGATAFQMKMNNSELEKASTDAVKYSAMATMKDLRTVYKSPDSTHSFGASFYGASMSPVSAAFGAPAPSAFGAPAPSAFGAPAPSAFGAPAPAYAAFGAPVAFGASAFGASNNATADDSYSVEADTIQTSQVERMVQKALKRAPKKK